MSLVVRPPSIPELAAEGWELWESDDPDSVLPLEMHWFHAPSLRAIEVSEARERVTFVDELGNEHTQGWFIICREHDKNGNPIEGSMHGPLPNMATAMRQARVLRRAIMAESRPDLRVTEQCELFPERAP
jgi:hypothetical protein